MFGVVPELFAGHTEMMTQAEQHWMELALTEARQAAAREEVPVGAVLIAADGKTVLAADGNRIVERHDPTAHAEIQVIRKAGAALGNERLVGTTLFVTLEPCAMCAGAISLARVSRVVFAATDPKGGAVLSGPRFFDQPTCHHRPEILQAEPGQGEASAALLRDFFRARR
jgi:tRNA(Arg) A34 adenosine deaminase TadA